MIVPAPITRYFPVTANIPMAIISTPVPITPSEITLKAEAKGRVMIYDGLTSKTISKAMDEQFNRIENMMFVRIIHEQDNGEYYVEDDGCD